MKHTMIVPSGMVLAEMPRENSVLELFALNFDFCEDFRLCDFGKGLRFFFSIMKLSGMRMLCVSMQQSLNLGNACAPESFRKLSQ